jgi:hypothetical protein
MAIARIINTETGASLPAIDSHANPISQNDEVKMLAENTMRSD